MLNTLVVPLVVAAAVYLYLPRPERNLLVVLQAKSKNLKLEKIQAIGQIKNAFKILQNVDSHMEHVDVASRLDYNYVLVSADLTKKGEEEQFRAKLGQLEFVNKMEIFPYTTNPVRKILLNFMLKIKGIIFDSSLTPSKEFEFDGLDSLCSGQNIQEGEKVMVNIVKMNEKNKEALEMYNNKVVFELFPKIGSFIFDMGKVDSDYWSMVALMHYQSVEEACRMVNSMEYAEVVKYKVEGLLDTHTYLTHQII